MMIHNQQQLMDENESNKDSCYIRVRTKSRGRILVAKHFIPKGHIIINELPFLVVPIQKSEPICLGCQLKFVLEINYCSKCQLPLCSKCCNNVTSHHSLECEALSYVQETPKFTLKKSSPFFASIGPLRYLLHHGTNIPDLNHHAEHMKEKDPKTWMTNSICIVGYIQKLLGMSHFSSDAIHRAIGVIRTNGVRLESKKGYGASIGIYPNYSFINHSCLPNTRMYKVIAIEDILEGNEILTRYVTPQLGTFRRQELFQTNWNFSCNCIRCQDPRELFTHTNSLKCRNCSDNYILPLEPRDLNSVWKCEFCPDVSLTASEVRNRIFSFNLSFDKNKNDEVHLEKLLSHVAPSLFHPNHFLCIGIRETLIQLKSKREKNDKTSLSQKVELFKALVPVMSIIDPPREQWIK